jgi:hypothetical protein
MLFCVLARGAAPCDKEGAERALKRAATAQNFAQMAAWDRIRQARQDTIIPEITGYDL